MRGFFVLVLWASLTGSVWADSARVAVASNFQTTAGLLKSAFESATGHRVDIVTGSSGGLYAQIVQGAPYDLFLSADSDRVVRLEQADMLGAARKTYAIGTLVLWSPDAGLLFPDIELSLRRETTRHFAMADPELAPYGRAAREVIAALGLDDVMAEKAVIGANIGQAFALVATGNAQMGLVALSQVTGLDGAWTSVPDSLHAPVIQDAGLLLHGADNAAARAFFAFLDSDTARRIIRQAGYAVAQ